MVEIKVKGIARWKQHPSYVWWKPKVIELTCLDCATLETEAVLHYEEIADQELVRFSVILMNAYKKVNCLQNINGASTLKRSQIMAFFR